NVCRRKRYRPHRTFRWWEVDLAALHQPAGDPNIGLAADRRRVVGVSPRWQSGLESGSEAASPNRHGVSELSALSAPKRDGQRSGVSDHRTEMAKGQGVSASPRTSRKGWPGT